MSERLIGIYVIAGSISVLICICIAFWLIRIERMKAFMQNIKDQVTQTQNGNTKYLMDPELIMLQSISLSKTVAVGLCILAAIIIICITSIINTSKTATKAETSKYLLDPNSVIQVNITCPSCKAHTTPLLTKPEVPDVPKDTAPQPLPTDSNTGTVPPKTLDPETMKKVTENDNSSK